MGNCHLPEGGQAMLSWQPVSLLLLLSSCLGGTYYRRGEEPFIEERRSPNKIMDGGMMMGLGKRAPLAERVPLFIELGKKSGFISPGGMRSFGKRRQNFISDGGMMMGLGKRSMGDARISDGGMMMGLGKRAPKSISDGGMMMGLGKRAPNSISEGGMMMGLGKRAPNSISEGGMMMGLGKRAGRWNDFIHNGGMTGLRERSEADY